MGDAARLGGGVREGAFGAAIDRRGSPI